MGAAITIVTMYIPSCNKEKKGLTLELAEVVVFIRALSWNSPWLNG